MIAKIDTMTKQYLECFGRALIGIYYMPPLPSNNCFSAFMNSLVITLRRMELLPQYFWWRDGSGGRYLVLWMNGYFGNDLSAITPVITRLWLRHNSTPATEVGCFLLTAELQEYSNTRLQQMLSAISPYRVLPNSCHQRTFGASRF